MSKKKAQECPAGEKWAVPDADFLSLLLALFIALWAISSTESSKAKALSQALVTAFSNPPEVFDISAHIPETTRSRRGA